MQCPHCQREYDAQPHVFALGEDPDGAWQVASARCPTCERLIVTLCTKDGCSYPIRPLAATRARLSADVPAEVAADYHAAAQIIYYSDEASAALSRRVLYQFLGERLDASEPGLHGRIRETLASPEVPAYLKEALRTYSRVARLTDENKKSTDPEALAPVQPGEADWLLDVLESLFELYFVEPARMRRKLESLEEQAGLLPGVGGSPAPPVDSMDAQE
jgi:hypothetical protein